MSHTKLHCVFVLASFSFTLAAQDTPRCTGITLDFDARCSCIKDPLSPQCALLKSGAYKPADFSKMQALINNSNGSGTLPAGTTGATPARLTAQPPPIQVARAQQAQVVPLQTKDYLRFIHPNATLVAGIDFAAISKVPELLTGIFGQDEGDDQTKTIAAFKEMDHLWLSVAGPADVVILMTGKFQQGAAAGLFYSQGIRPVFLGGANAMIVGPDPAIQAALGRLAKPAATGGWVASRAREMSKDHQMWLVDEQPAGGNQAAVALRAVHQFSLGLRVTGEVGLDGEVVADSDSGAEQIATWVERVKTRLREKTGKGALDALTTERSGATLRFAAKSGPETSSPEMDSELAVELYSVMMTGFPGVSKSAVSADKLRAVKTGMKRDEVLALLGRPLSVSSIQGLEVPRETWTYQVPFGKRLSLRLDDGVVTLAPSL